VVDKLPCVCVKAAPQSAKKETQSKQKTHKTDFDNLFSNIKTPLSDPKSSEDILLFQKRHNILIKNESDFIADSKPAQQNFNEKKQKGFSQHFSFCFLKNRQRAS
jgi:hypothetical protein